MNFRIVTGPHGRTRVIDLTGPRLLLASVLVVGIFIAGLALGRFLLGGNADDSFVDRIKKAVREQRKKTGGQR